MFTLITTGKDNCINEHDSLEHGLKLKVSFGEKSN